MRLAVGTIFYNDVFGLNRLCSSVYKGVDYIFAIDGRFPNWGEPDEPLLSTDGSRQVIKDYPNAMLFDAPIEEPKKRSVYLDLCAKYQVDFLLILDTDEWSEKCDKASWDIFREEIYQTVQVKYGGRHNVFAVYIQVAARSYDDTVRDTDIWLKDAENDISYGQYPRLWYQPYNLEYRGNIHYLYHNKNRGHPDFDTQQIPPREILKSMRFRHDHQLRSPEHQRKRRTYQQDFLVPSEGNLISHFNTSDYGTSA